jgi:hypothetical protein
MESCASWVLCERVGNSSLEQRFLMLTSLSPRIGENLFSAATCVQGDLEPDCKSPYLVVGNDPINFQYSARIPCAPVTERQRIG